jgi:hypothetical protein
MVYSSVGYTVSLLSMEGVKENHERLERDSIRIPRE